MHCQQPHIKLKAVRKSNFGRNYFSLSTNSCSIVLLLSNIDEMHWAVAHHHALAELTITTTYPHTTTSFQGERKKVKVIFQWYKWYFNNNNLPPYNHKFPRRICESDCSMTTTFTPYNHKLSRRIWGKLEKRKWQWYFNDNNLTPYNHKFSRRIWAKLEEKKVKVIF